MREYYIIRSSCKHKDDHEKDHKEEKKEFWDDPNYKKYLEKHGDHFCDRLAEWASKKMMNNPNADQNHSWSVDQVTSVFAKLGYSKPEANTWGDATYAANMAYADYYGISLATEESVLKQGYADMIDPDGYPGKIFNRWLADVMGKGIDVPWGEFI